MIHGKTDVTNMSTEQATLVNEETWTCSVCIAHPATCWSSLFWSRSCPEFCCQAAMWGELETSSECAFASIDTKSDQNANVMIASRGIVLDNNLTSNPFADTCCFWDGSRRWGGFRRQRALSLLKPKVNAKSRKRQNERAYSAYSKKEKKWMWKDMGSENTASIGVTSGFWSWNFNDSSATTQDPTVHSLQTSDMEQLESVHLHAMHMFSHCKSRPRVGRTLRQLQLHPTWRAHHLPFKDFWNFKACSSVMTLPAWVGGSTIRERFCWRAVACFSASSLFFERNFPSSFFLTTDRAWGSFRELNTTVKLTSSPTSHRWACLACKYTSCPVLLYISGHAMKPCPVCFSP